MESRALPGELSVKLFWDLANALPAENHTNKLLRSYYLTTCKKIGRREVKLPPEQFASSVMCSKCSSIWSDSKFSLTLKPQRIHTEKAKRLVEALKNDPKSLTKKNRNRAKWLKKRIASNVEIKCEFCQKKTLQPLIGTKKSKIVEKQEPVVEEVPIKKKKKKKGKDKTAGLNLEKVISKEMKPSSAKKTKENEGQDMTTELKLEKRILEEVKPSSAKKGKGNERLDKTTELQVQKVILQEMKPSSAKKGKGNEGQGKTTGLKLNRINSQEIKPSFSKKGSEGKVVPQNIKPTLSKKINKQKVQPQKSKVQLQKAKPEKVMSNTQKQNSLLQLANMLKNRSSTVSSKGNNQLEKLLR